MTASLAKPASSRPRPLVIAPGYRGRIASREYWPGAERDRRVIAGRRHCYTRLPGNGSNRPKPGSCTVFPGSAYCPSPTAGRMAAAACCTATESRRSNGRLSFRRQSRTSSLGVIPVIKADGRMIGNGKPGELSLRIFERFREITRSTGTPIYS